MSNDSLDKLIENTTTHISNYENLTSGNWIATIPLAKKVRGAPVVRTLSLEGRTDHGEALRNVLTYTSIDDAVQQAFSQGEFRFNLAQGFHGNGFESLDQHAQSFLKVWEAEYLTKYREYRQHLDAHDEIKNYRNVMFGALKGIAAGTAVGIGLDGLSTWTGSNNVYWEIGARSLPAILEAEEIARPFFGRFKEWVSYKRGKINEKPKPFTPTEIWSLTQLAGPIVGFGMLVVGEETGLNENPFYRATAVFTVNTGNNVIGGGSAYTHFFREARAMRYESNPLYKNFRFGGTKKRDKLKNYLYNSWQIIKSKQRLKDLKDDIYLGSCNFWMNSFQSSNAIVAGSWYSAELVLRYFGIAAEKVDFGGGFGGKTLAAVESGLLSADTAVAAKMAIEREKLKLHRDVAQLTNNQYLNKLYTSSNSG